MLCFHKTNAVLERTFVCLLCLFGGYLKKKVWNGKNNCFTVQMKVTGFEVFKCVLIH